MLAGYSVIKHAIDGHFWHVHRDGIKIGSEALKIGPHSVDVSLGGKFIRPRKLPDAIEDIMHMVGYSRSAVALLDPYEEQPPANMEWKLIEADYYDLMPGEFILGYVRERFDSSKPIVTGSKPISSRAHEQIHVLGKPRHFTQLYDGRSTMGRLGIMSHITAGYGDLGFNSNFTLEIYNVNRDIAVRLHRGMRIGQICFDDVANLDENPKMYDGSYTAQHDMPVKPVLGWQRFVQPGETYPLAVKTP
jgi:deoxycytidine triphosphate deaminase